MLNPVDAVIAALDHAGCNPRPGGTGQWSARCPAHEDHNPSLSVGVGKDGQVLLNCFAGCPVESVVAALGLQMTDLWPKTDVVPSNKPASNKANNKASNKANGKPQAKPQAHYPTANDALESARAQYDPESAKWDYYDANGNLVGMVLRWDKEHGKEIRPISRHADGWKIAAMPEPRPLYRLRELLAADKATPVVVCEGEKAADAAAECGLLAVTSAGGAKAAKQTDWMPLAGRRVIILPDHDEAGEKYAEDVARLAYTAKAKEIRILRLADHAPRLPKGGDIADVVTSMDFCGIGLGDAAQKTDLGAYLLQLAEKVIPWKPKDKRPHVVAVNLGTIAPEELAWLWPGRVPLGKLTLLAGDPGLGKSFITLDIAARVSAGLPWPDVSLLSAPMGRVVLLNVEDDIADTIIPRLINLGANRDNVEAITSVEVNDERHHFSLQTDLATLDSFLDQMPDTRLIVIDPIDAYLDRVDSHKSAEVRGLLAPLAELASRRKVAVVAVTHLSKTGGTKAIYRAMGSLAFAAAARSVWMVAKDQHDPQRRLFLPAKLNIAQCPSGLAFTIKDGCVAWEANPVHMHADDALAAEVMSVPSQQRRREAAAWLRERLTVGPMPASEVIEQAQAVGIAEKTLRRAFKELGGHSYKQGENWSWCLPHGQDGH